MGVDAWNINGKWLSSLTESMSWLSTLLTENAKIPFVYTRWGFDVFYIVNGMLLGFWQTSQYFIKLESRKWLVKNSQQVDQ